MKRASGVFVERYLQAVRSALPDPANRDTLDFLTDGLKCDFKEEEIRLQGQMTEEEELAFLAKRKSPMLLAMEQYPKRFLIGPLLYRQYMRTMKTVLTACLALWLFEAALVLFIPAFRAKFPGCGLAVAFLPVWNITFYSTTLTTVLFALGEHFELKWMQGENWDPSRLPAIRHEDRIPRTSSAMALIIGTLLLLLCLKVLPVPFISGWELHLSRQISVTFLWPIAAFSVALMAIALSSFLRPWWSRLLAGVRLAVDASGFVIFAFLLRAGLLSGKVMVVVTPAMLPQDAAIFEWLASLLVICAELAVETWLAVRLALDVRKLRGKGANYFPPEPHL